MAVDRSPESDAEEAMAPTRTNRRELGIQKKLAALESRPVEKLRPSPPGHGPGSHSIIASMLRRHSHRWYAVAWRISTEILITITVVNFILESEKDFQTCCTTYFDVFEGFVSCVFLVEFCLKILTIPERKAYRDSDPWLARIHWVFSGSLSGSMHGLQGESWIDALSCLPWFIALMLGIPQGPEELFRMVRLIRIFKSAEVWAALRLVSRVFYYNGTILMQGMLLCGFMLLVCSIGLYYARPEHDDQDDFSSVLASMYLAVLMLTGQGEPNGVMPWYTRIIISIVALFAIAQFAIPASMLTWGFEQEAEHDIVKEHDREKKAAQREAEGNPICESSSSSDEGDRVAEWDGYLEQVLGSDFEKSSSSEESGSSKEKGGEQQKAQREARELSAQAQELLQRARSGDCGLSTAEMKRCKAIFEKLDSNGDGFLGWRKIRAITESDESAQALAAHISAHQEITGDDKVSLREFYVWLGHIKTSYTRYGEKVFLRFLRNMESKLFEKRSAASLWKKASNTVHAASLLKRATQAREASRVPQAQMPQAKSAAQQLLLIANHYGDLQKENADLEGKISRMERELAALKPSP